MCISVKVKENGTCGKQPLTLIWTGIALVSLQQLNELSTGVLKSIKLPWLWLQTSAGVNERSQSTLWDASICWSSSSADFTATQLEHKLRDSSVASIPQVKTAWSNYTVGHRLINELKQHNQSSWKNNKPLEMYRESEVSTWCIVFEIRTIGNSV